MELQIKPLPIEKHWLLEGDRRAVKPGLVIVVAGSGFLYSNRHRLYPGDAVWIEQIDEVLPTAKETCLFYHLTLTGHRCALYRQDAEILHDWLRQLHVSPTSEQEGLTQLRILYQLLETLSGEQESHVFEEVTAAWLKDLSMQRSVHELALDLGMSVPTFNRLFKERYHATPKEYVTQLRIRTAKEWMLASYEMTLAQIAQKVGLQDEFYFSRLFKKRTGLSPTHFLQRITPRIGIASRLLLQDHLLALGLQPILAPSYPTEYGASGLPVFLTGLDGTRLYDANQPLQREWFETTALDLIIKTPSLEKGQDISWLPADHVLELPHQTCWSEYLRLIAVATNREDRLEPIVAQITALEQTVKERLAWNKTGTWAVVWIRPDEVRLYGTKQHTMLSFLFHDLGLTPAPGLPEAIYEIVTLETLQRVDPENLLILWSQPVDVERIQQEESWQTLQAVRRHQVHYPDSVDWDPWGPLGRTHMLKQLLDYIENEPRLICP